MNKERILVVDDEEAICDVISFNLEIEGFEVEVAYSAEEALTKDIASKDLLILDVMMGRTSGFTLARQLKDNPATASIPIIFCTAKDTENDTVAGFTIGADDYIHKPFSVREVVARVKAVLRRSKAAATQQPLHSEAPSQPTHLEFEQLAIDLNQKVCMIGGQTINLAKKEFEILSLLLSNRGHIFSREELLRYVWHSDVVVGDRTVDVCVTRLRKKIGPYGNYIVTRHGYGYGFIEKA